MASPKALADRYQLTAHIARGGMADVFEATDLMLDRQVAVKILHRQFAGTDTFVARFRKEAQAAANLTHPNIVSIFDWGEQNGTYFIVMELVKGRSLRDILKSEGFLLPRRAVEVAVEVASALEVAHRNRVIHRDNKPGNILLGADGTVKVTDFGVARAWDDSQELTKTGSVIGTATYFSPEQARGESADERSDIYSLGVVLYEMLTGHPPFSGESPVSVAYQHVATEPTAASSLNPDVPAELDRIIHKALQKDPARRYQTAHEIRGDLLLFLRGEERSVYAEPPAPVPEGRMPQPLPAHAPAPAGYSDLPPPTVPPDEVYRRVQPAPRRRTNLPAIIGAVVVAAVAVVASWWVLNNLSTDTPEETVPTTALALQVPDVIGLTEAQAREELQALGLRVTPVPEASEDVQVGSVIRTEPRTDRDVEPGGIVSVFVSSGPDLIPVPNVVGSTQQRAITQLRGQGFDVQIETANSDTVGLGLVISQMPGGAESAQPGTAVVLTVSVGPVPVEVPSVFGFTEEAAVQVLSGLGFDVSIRREPSDAVNEGLVAAQRPVAGTPSSPGLSVEIIVSEGANTITLPALASLPTEEAVSRLGSLGLTVQVTQENHPEVGAGLVIRTDPSAESEVQPGDQVTVVVSIGPDLVSVPELLGLTFQEAEEALEPLGLLVEMGDPIQVGHPDFQDLVVEQRPEPNEELLRGGTVTVFIGEYIEPDTTLTTDPESTP